MTRLSAAFLCGAALTLGGAPALADGHMGGGKMTVNTHFMAADVDADGRVTRDEFVSYSARNGLNAGMAEAEYQRRVGGNAYLSSDAFGDFDPIKIAQGRIARGAVQATSPVSGDFARYDADGDGRVSFREFNALARKQGMTSTQAAQRFVKMAGGRSYLDAGSFGAAMSVDPSVYDKAAIRSRIDSARLEPNGRVVTTLGGVSVSSPRDDDPTVQGGTSTERGFVFERDYTTTGRPRATVDRMHTPEDKRLGDLDSTPSPRMKVWGEEEPEGSLFGISD